MTSSPTVGIQTPILSGAQPLVIPSGASLISMITSAEAKFEAAREQANLKKEAAALLRMERTVMAGVKGRRYAVRL